MAEKNDGATIIASIYRNLEKDLFRELASAITEPVAEFITEPYGEGCCIVNYNGLTENVIVPETINDIPVLAIKDRAFCDCKKVKQVILPEGLLHIGEKAFWGSKITQVIIPSSVTTIGRAAFSYSSIKELCIPASVTTIPEELCEACDKLKIVVVLGATTIKRKAFCYCDKLEKVALPNSLLEVGADAFSWCPKLKFLIIPKSVERIYVQNGCSNDETDEVSLNLAILNDKIEWLKTGTGEHEGYFEVNLFSNKGSSTDLISKIAIGDHGDLNDFAQMANRGRK